MRNKLRTYASAAAILAVALAGCSSSSNNSSETPAPTTSSAPQVTQDAQWPKTVEHAAGSTTIEQAPLRIVSTSPSLTGTLLALDAPIIGSGAATVTALSDDKGFFKQWAAVADERGVEVVYGNLELDLDAIDAFAPDLIIGSANGGDTTLEAYSQLDEIAPTILLDYSSVTWQELTVQLGDILGLQDNADKLISEYDSWVASQKDLIDVPEQPVNLLVYLGADGLWSFTGDTAPAELLKSLGFDYYDIPEELSGGNRNGVAVVSAENMPAALSGAQSLFVIPITGPAELEAFKADPLIANVPAVAEGRVFDLGSGAFRLDYYSAKETVELLVDTFGK